MENIRKKVTATFYVELPKKNEQWLQDPVYSAVQTFYGECDNCEFIKYEVQIDDYEDLSPNFEFGTIFC